ncbi:MAG: OmpA family protein [Bacteroidaceae bacterium]|nr:OmpA family protein [Bacteroidaceae bacterium]
MKKLILSLSLVCACAAANAQQTIYNPKFTDNVYIGINGGVNTNLAFDEAFPLNPTFGIRLGKDFNPIFGVFVEGSAWFGSHSEKDSRIFPQRFDVYPSNPDGKHNAFRAANVGVYGTINLMNAFCGYQGEPRPFEISTVAGLGWGMVFVPSSDKNDTHFVAQTLGVNEYKDEDRDHLSAKAGLDFTFNLGSQKEHQIYIEPAVIWNLNKSGFDGIEFNKHYAYLSLSLGYNYKFGCSYGGHNFKAGRDCDAELAKLQALLDECNRKQPQVITKEVIKEVPKEVIKYVEKPGIAMENLKVVPFEVNKWYISDNAQNDLNSIPAGAHVQIIGTASPEGNAGWNQELSNNRAQAVADYLKERGVVVDSCEGRGVEGKTSNRLAIVYVVSRPQ